jgi:hypothetical protein
MYHSTVTVQKGTYDKLSCVMFHGKQTAANNKKQRHMRRAIPRYFIDAFNYPQCIVYNAMRVNGRYACEDVGVKG